MSVAAVLVKPFYPGFIAQGLVPGTTVPVLTSPSVNPGSTTAILSASTDVSGGTLYAVVTTSATPPSAAQVIAGQDHTGASAVSDGSVGVYSTGVNSVNLGGLTADTAGYYGYIVHEAPGGNSLVAQTGTFGTGTSGGDASGVGLINNFTVRF